MISEDGALIIAQSYLDHGSPGFTFSFFSTLQRESNDWSMAFEWGTGNESVFDGPIIVLVDKQTGRVRSLREDIEERVGRD